MNQSMSAFVCSGLNIKNAIKGHGASRGIHSRMGNLTSTPPPRIGSSPATTVTLSQARVVLRRFEYGSNAVLSPGEKMQLCGTKRPRQPLHKLNFCQV